MRVVVWRVGRLEAYFATVLWLASVEGMFSGGVSNLNNGYFDFSILVCLMRSVVGVGFILVSEILRGVDNRCCESYKCNDLNAVFLYFLLRDLESTQRKFIECDRDGKRWFYLNFFH